MKKMTILLSLFMVCGIFALQAQTVQITGTVISTEDGAPIPGVSVVVRGTTIGTVTDQDGVYSLDVPAAANILVFSFVGMRAQEVAIQGRSIIDVTLEPDVLGLWRSKQCGLV